MAFNQNVELVGPYASSAARSTGSSSYTFSAPAAGLYSIDYKLQIPSISQGAGTSGLLVTVYNTTTSSTILSQSGGVSGGKIRFLAAAADAIQFDLSSTDADDLLTKNTVKATLAITSGV